MLQIIAAIFYEITSTAVVEAVYRIFRGIFLAVKRMARQFAAFFGNPRSDTPAD
jgi:hypothetical protein